MVKVVAKNHLIHGAHYKGECRNAEVARWDAERGKFVYWRHKWGQRFTEEICHPYDDKVYDVFTPTEMILVTKVIPFYEPG